MNVADTLPRVHSTTEAGGINLISLADPRTCTVFNADRKAWVFRYLLDHYAELGEEYWLQTFEHEGGAYFRIHSSNRGPIVYRLTGYSIGNDCYLAELVD